MRKQAKHKTKRGFFLFFLIAGLLLLGELAYYGLVVLPAERRDAATSSVGEYAAPSETAQPVSQPAETVDAPADSAPLPFGGTPIVTETEELQEEEPLPEPEPVFEPYDLHLLMVGDNLLHMTIVKQAKTEEGGYNFDFEFEFLKPFLEQADIKIINQETPLAGNELGFSGFPAFNSPVEAADAIQNAGFNVMLAATNHCADQGLSGLISFADYVEEHCPDVMLCGIRGSEPSVCNPDPEQISEEVLKAADLSQWIPEASEDGTPAEWSPALQSSLSRINLMQVGDFTFAILNYTYGTNQEFFAKELDGHVDFLSVYNEKNRLINMEQLNPVVPEDIRLARQLADIVIVCPHWGNEFQTKPSAVQQSFAQQMADAGADLIIGAHPHIVQPVEVVTAADGREVLCYYSLGNYVSTQKECRAMYEAMAWVTFSVTEEGIRVDNEKSGALPFVLQYAVGPLRMTAHYALEDYTQELAAAHGIKSWGEGPMNLEKLQTWKEETLGGYALTREDILGDR